MLEGDLKMWFRPVDVDEGDKEYGDLDLGLVEDVGHEGHEVRVIRVAG